MTALPQGQAFTKLEALGNDFVLLDFRNSEADPSRDEVRSLADRKTGIGFDQLLILRCPDQPGNTARVEIFNADGSTARQCGNGMRAIGLCLHEETPERREFALETAAGLINVRVDSPDAITADMGLANFDPRAVHLDPDTDLPARLATMPGLLDFGTVSVGNPHLILLLDRAAEAETVQRLGSELSTWPGFVDGVNVSFACIQSPDHVRLQVHERGAGSTRACGSAACATAAWLIHRGKMRSPLNIEQPGGALVINWPDTGRPIIMTGPARRVFDGRL